MWSGIRGDGRRLAQAQIFLRLHTAAWRKFISIGKPMPPAVTSMVTMMYTHWPEPRSNGLESPPSTFENPALQNAESEWNPANTISSSTDMPSVSCTDRKIATAPASSIMMVNARMYNSVGNSALMVLEYTMSRTMSWLYMDVLPLKNSAKKLVKVITPKPPVWIRSASTRIPAGVNVAVTSTEVSPVMHTAEVETKSASV